MYIDKLHYFRSCGNADGRCRRSEDWSLYCPVGCSKDSYGLDH